MLTITSKSRKIPGKGVQKGPVIWTSKVKSLRCSYSLTFVQHFKRYCLLIVHDPEKAQNSIVDLSEMLRQTFVATGYLVYCL